MRERGRGGCRCGWRNGSGLPASHGGPGAATQSPRQRAGLHGERAEAALAHGRPEMGREAGGRRGRMRRRTAAGRVSSGADRDGGQIGCPHLKTGCEAPEQPPFLGHTGPHNLALPPWARSWRAEAEDRSV
eukprot:207401-Chlamydomonas_euryale.AAC.4